MTATRVLIVAPSLGILGGQAVQARVLHDRLSQSRLLEVGFLAVNPVLPGPLAALQRVKYVRTVVTSIAYLGALARTVRRYDVVHAFSASYWSFLLAPLPALLAARMAGRRAVLNYHSGEAPDHLANWPLSRWLMRRVPHALVVPSRFLADVFERFGMRAAVIGNFVPLERLPYRPRSALRPALLSNRNLEPMYGVGTVLQAFAKVQARVPAASLLVAGDGSERPALEALARSLGLRNVTFLGRVPNDRIGNVYDRCDLFVNASRIDNMPLSLMEAFACGLPVVTSGAGGIPGLVEHERTGLVMSDPTPEDLAGAVLELLDDPAKAERLALAARSVAEESYAWERVGPRWESFYAGVASGAEP